MAPSVSNEKISASSFFFIKKYLPPLSSLFFLPEKFLPTYRLSRPRFPINFDPSLKSHAPSTVSREIFLLILIFFSHCLFSGKRVLREIPTEKFSEKSNVSKVIPAKTNYFWLFSHFDKDSLYGVPGCGTFMSGSSMNRA